MVLKCLYVSCFQQKTKLQKMHAQMQEAHSMRQLELAKSTNIDKLVSVLFIRFWNNYSIL